MTRDHPMNALQEIQAWDSAESSSPIKLRHQDTGVIYDWPAMRLDEDGLCVEDTSQLPPGNYTIEIIGIGEQATQ